MPAASLIRSTASAPESRFGPPLSPDEERALMERHAGAMSSIKTLRLVDVRAREHVLLAVLTGDQFWLERL